jgi:hypothetical protein
MEYVGHDTAWLLDSSQHLVLSLRDNTLVNVCSRPECLNWPHSDSPQYFYSQKIYFQLFFVTITRIHISCLCTITPSWLKLVVTLCWLVGLEKCISVCLSVSLFIHPSIPPLYLPTYLLTYLPTYPSIYPSIHPFIYPCILHVYIYIYTFLRIN